MSDAPKRRTRRAANPLDLRTYTENYQVLPAVEKRLELGGWRAMHVRVQGDRKAQNSGKPRLGVLTGVPFTSAWGWPDWVALHPAEARPLVLELKSEDGQLTDAQLDWLIAWTRAGAEIAIVRPRDIFVPRDPLTVRLVEHRACVADIACQGDTESCSGWCRARREAHELVVLGSSAPAQLRRALSRAGAVAPSVETPLRRPARRMPQLR